MKRRFDRPPARLGEARTVTSLTNQTVKDIRALSMRKVREEAGLITHNRSRFVPHLF